MGCRVVVESGQDTRHEEGDAYTLNTVTQRRATIEAGGNVTLASLAGNASVISSTLDSGGTIQINTPNGALYLGARPPSRLRRSKRSSQFQPSTAWGIRGKDLYDYREQGVKEGLFTATYTNKGEIHETVVPTLMTAAGNIAIVTKDGVIVDYKDTGSLTGSIDQLSQAPGLAWMKDLQSRSDVQWNAVQEAHQSWDHSSQGISTMGALIISAAVAVATSGMGANLAGIVAEGSQAAAGAGVAAGGLQAGSTVALASGGTATVASASTVAMTNAGFTTLVSQAATALVGNGGDIGAALKQMGSMASLKSLATSVVTAGLMAEIPFDKLTTSTDGLSGDALKMTEFGNTLKTRLAQATVKATVDSVINGTPLTESMKTNLVSAAADSVSQFGSQLLGEMGLSEGDLRKVLGHAFVGGMSNAITGDDFVMGAASGAVTELASPLIGQTFSDGATAEELARGREARIQLAGVIAASTVALAGGDEGDIYRAASIAQIAQQFNHELHPNIDSVIDKLKARREQMDEVLTKTDPEAVKAVLQRMADAHTNTLDDIDISGLDENALAAVQKYPGLINHIQLINSETVGAAAGIAQSVGETVEDTLLLVTDQIYAAAWTLTGGWAGEGLIGGDAAARVDAVVQVVSNYQQIPDSLKAYYQAQQDLIAQYRALGTDEGDSKAQQISAKLSTDVTLIAAAILTGGEGLVVKAGEVITALKVGKTAEKVAGEVAGATKGGLFDDLANFRKELDLSPVGSAADKSTLAVVEVNGQKIYGINAHGQSVSGVNAISSTHAEIDALNQIKQKGIDVSGQDLTLYVDRTPCVACGTNGGIRSMVEQLGLKTLTVISPDGPMTITPR